MSGGTSPRFAIVGTASLLPSALDVGAFRKLALAAGHGLSAAPREWADLLTWTRGLTAGLVTPPPFDWKRFRMPPLQAERLHRNEQLLLQALDAALTDAGVIPGTTPTDRLAIYLGATGFGVDERIDHGLRLHGGALTRELAEALPGPSGAQHLAAVTRALETRSPPIGGDSISTTASISAGRLAGLFDAWGGHFAVDAGPASGLAALRLATQALTLNQCDQVVVGAVAPLVSPSTFAAIEARGWLSAGVPHVLDGRADGMVPGEGAAAVVIRRLEDAQRDGQPILAVLHAVSEAASSSQGVASIGKVVERAARKALEAAGAEPDAVAHVEAQAPGVVTLEDEELFGLHAAYAARHAGPVSVTSAASNVGFLQAASGLVSLVRAVETLRHGVRLPIAGLEGPRKRESLRLQLQAQAEPLPPGAWVGVSSHAFGGLGLHALLGPASDAKTVQTPRASPKRTKRRDRAPLAIVGVGALAPGAQNAQSLWANILGKVDAIADLAGRRFNPERFRSELLPEASVLPQLAGLVDLPTWDPLKLRLPPQTLARQDRAVLLTLRAAEEALSSAGYTEGDWAPSRVRVVVGQLPMREREVELERRITLARFLRLAEEALAGSGLSTEQRRVILAVLREQQERGLISLGDDTLSWTSGLPCAARVAARHGFEGGALSVDAACASSMVAIHAAALSLWSRESDVVLAGGVAFNLVPEYYVALSALGALSARGSFPFDARADGFIPGEGAGMVVLKRIEDAEAAGDRVLAVISGIGFSSDGSGHSLFAPNPKGQARAVQRALDDAAVIPDWVDLIEAHGTGSPTADLCETRAYTSVFADRDVDRPVSMGSIKSQVGHLSSAGGVLGVIKTAFALHDHRLPPMNGGEYPHPELNLERSPLALSLESRAWHLPASGVRRAGVSAFGLGGSNYHLLLEEHDNAHRRERRAPPQPKADPHPEPGRGLSADRWTLELVARAPGPQRETLERRRLIILGAQPELERALMLALESRGAQGVALRLEEGMSSEEVEKAVRTALEDGADGILDCGAFVRPEPFLGRGAAAFRRAMHGDAARWLGAGRALYPLLMRADGRRPIYAAVTAMGGDLGFHGDAGAVLGGASHGFLKALKHEAPSALIKAIDFDALADVAGVAEAVLEELEEGSDRVEIARLGGRRFVVALRNGSHRGNQQVRRPIDPEWVILFSGGGRGAVFEVAKGMARHGARVVVTGRTPIPRGDEPYLHLDEAAFEAFRREEMVRAKRRDPTLTPVQFNRRFDTIVRARELWANLEEAFALGLPLQYEVCDIRDASEVAALADQIRATYGRIDGVVHGAMLEDSKSLPDKTLELLTTTLEVKVMGLLHLLEATRSDALQLVMCFGSGAGRFGNRGQTDYAAANDLMAKCVMAYAHRARRDMRCVTIDWTAWEGVGAAVRTRHMVETTGVSSISPAEGVYWFINELMLGDRTREVAIFDERLFRDWPFLGASADGPGGASPFDDAGRLLVPSDFPMVDRLESEGPERAVYSRTLDVERDLFLLQHRLYGVPIVPGTFGIELLAEGAALACPELTVHRVEAVQIETPLKLFHGRPMRIELHVTRGELRGGEETLGVEVVSDLVVGGRVQRTRVHCRGQVVMGPRRRFIAGTGRLPDQLTGARAKSIFHLAKDPVALGPLFCRADWVYVGHASVEGIIRAPRQRDVFSDLTAPRFQVDPLLLDTAFQVAANWDGHHLGVVSIPMGVGRLLKGRDRRLSESAHVRAYPLTEDGREVTYDVEVLGEDGMLLLKVERLWLRRLETPADPGR